MIAIPKNCRTLTATADIVNDGTDRRCDVTEIANPENGDVSLHFTFYNICGKNGKDGIYDAVNDETNRHEIVLALERDGKEYAEQLKKETAELNRVYAANINSLLKANEDRNATIAELQKELEAKGDADLRLPEAEAELAMARQELTDMGVRLSKSEQELSELEGELVRTEGECETLSRSLSEAQRMLDAEKLAHTGTQAALQAAQDAVKRLDVELDAEKQKASDDRKQLAIKDGVIESLTASNGILTKHNEELEAAVATGESAASAAQIASLNATIRSLNAQVADLQGQIAGLRQEIEEKDALIAELREGASVKPPVTEPTPEPEQKQVAVWDFAGTLNGSGDAQFQLNSGEIRTEADGVSLVMAVDATAGKLASREASGDTQINAGTKLTVPVTDGAVIKITKLAGTFAINGEECDEYAYSGDTGEVTVECVSNGYITKLAVENIDLSAFAEKDGDAQGRVTATWDFAGTLNGSDETQFQQNEGVLHTSIPGIDGSVVTMRVDATNGKLAAREANGDTQINTGTALFVPVTDGAKVKIDALAGTFLIDRIERTEYVHEGETRELLIVCRDDGYIKKITIENLDYAEIAPLPEEEDEVVVEPTEAGGKFEPLEDGTPGGRIATTAPEEAGTITLYRNSVTEEFEGDTLNDVFDYIKEVTVGEDDWKIELSPGTYEAIGLNYKGNERIEIVGDSDAEYGTDVLIVGQGTDMTLMSARSLLSFEGKSNVVIRNVTLKNSYALTPGDAQAETLGVSNGVFSGTIACHNCSFLSGQDTICTTGKAWFCHCYVEGDTDFIWLDSRSGKVALYEDCVIRAIGGRTANTYFCSPRLAVGGTVFKGVVIWHSIMQVEDTFEKVYIGRNPWGIDTPYFNDFYENVAIIGTRFQSNVPLNMDVWKGGAHGTDNQQYVGFKTDSYFPRSYSWRTNGARRLTDEQVEAEYGNRNKILNRSYNTAKKKFENDWTGMWDTDALNAAFGCDAAGELPPDEVDRASVKATWNFAGTLNGSKTNAYQKNVGLVPTEIPGISDSTINLIADATAGKLAAREANGDTQINAGTKLTVPVTKGAVVSVTKVAGTFTINGEECDTYKHSALAQKVEICCTANGYITEVSVDVLDYGKLTDELKGLTW